jgi:hypothetical protein
MFLPKARTHQLIVRTLPEETLIYDQTADKAHCLNRTAALVWKHCDGKTSAAQLAAVLKSELGIPAGEPLIHLTLEKLARRRLLENYAEPSVRQDRRKMLRKLALAALPVILTITAPRTAQAASQAGPTPPTCPPGQTMCSGVCVNLQSNVSNCGTCGHSCGPNATTCQSGACCVPLNGFCAGGLPCCFGSSCNGVNCV